MTSGDPGHHAQPTAVLIDRFTIDAVGGLSTAEAQARLKTHGPNKLPEAAVRPRWLRFLDQFRNSLVLVLLVGALVAAIFGDLKDAVAIAAVLILNATLGYVQEQRAATSLEALNEMLHLQVRARRDNEIQMVDVEDLVVGDVVEVEAGDRIPADARILECHALQVNESSLTGESMPVEKSSADLIEVDVPLAERSNTVFMQTHVTRGRAVLGVVATGGDTQIGQVAAMVADFSAGKTPLQAQLDRLGKVLAAISAGAVAFYFSLSVIGGKPVADTLVSAVALLVAAVPEGLPAVVTLTLALGTTRLATGGAIVKKLRSVETLGSASVICSDKTGTLTFNQMTVGAVSVFDATVEVSGEGYSFDGHISAGVAPEPLEALGRVAVLCNDSQVRDGEVIGDPTEGALVVLAHKLGIDEAKERQRWSRRAEVPFDSEHRMMVTAHSTTEGDTLVSVKGAFEEVVARSVSALRADGTAADLDADSVEGLRAEAARFAERGMRVLALAQYPGGGDKATLEVSSLTLLGLVAMVDPPRAEAREAVSECQKAGISVKMITGDNVVTAGAIAESVGIVGEAIDGADLDALDDATLAERIHDVGIFARVSPRHKMRIVSALKANGRIVAMTGDGVNDAPALVAADIGIAMGQTGTEVAKEAADVVLASDDFSTIVGAVREGRIIYDNIVKFVRFQLATNVGALLIIIIAELFGLPTPFSPIQLLWINLIMDGPPALALAVDPAARGIMERRPRSPGSQILSPVRLARIGLTGAVMTAGTLGLFVYARGEWDTEVALTMAFTTFVLFQVVNALSVRDEYGSMLTARTFTNWGLWAALALVITLQVVAVEVVALHGFFTTTDMTAAQWALSGVVALSLVVFEELALVAGAGRAADRAVA